jgi:hypothetical protein
VHTFSSGLIYFLLFSFFIPASAHAVPTWLLSTQHTTPMRPDMPSRGAGAAPVHTPVARSQRGPFNAEGRIPFQTMLFSLPVFFCFYFLHRPARHVARD